MNTRLLSSLATAAICLLSPTHASALGWAEKIWTGGGKYGNCEGFSVENGVMVAREDSKHVGGILWMSGEHETFVMHVSVKADRPADGGIYILSDGNGNGYQVRLDNWESGGNIGGIYCDGLDGGIVAGTGCFSETWKQGLWNAIKIKVSKFKNPKDEWLYRVEVWVNGVRVTNFERADAKGKRIGLQLHSGIQADHHKAGSVVCFKDLSVQ